MSVSTQCRDINELLPAAKKACNLFLEECKKAGLDIFITETYRSQARQSFLYEQGRSRPGQKVTWTKKSRHTSRLAWDIAVNPPKDLYDNATLKKAGEIAKRLGITWGGSWKGTPDMPHFEVQSNWTPPANGNYTAAEKSYLEQGDQGDKVKQLQIDLVKLGYDTGGVDGIYGKATANAVMILQRRTGLAADGIAGENTLAKIKVLLEKETKSSTPGKYRVYTGAFKTEEEAEKQAKLIGEKLGYKPFPKDKRVWTGQFTTLESAMTAQQNISRHFGFNPQIRQE